MKNFFYLTLFFAFTLSLQLHAQKTNTWKGNFPGQEKNWNCPKNWSLGITPDWNCHVSIPALTSENKNYPCLSGDAGEIFSLTIAPGASLEIAPAGILRITGVGPFDTPVQNEGTLFVNGKLTISDQEKPVIANHE